VPGPVGAEGWYRDPYHRHERRWFSAGKPTPLVKDGDVEGRDQVSGPPPEQPVPIEEPGWNHGQDLARVDTAEAEAVSAPDLARADHRNLDLETRADADLAAGESDAVD